MTHWGFKRKKEKIRWLKIFSNHFRFHPYGLENESADHQNQSGREVIVLIILSDKKVK